MKKTKIILLLTAVFGLLLFLVFGCFKLTDVTDLVTNPSAREIYEREFKDNKPLFDRWQHAYTNAINDSIEINLSYVEKGSFFPNQFVVYTYNFELLEGRKLEVSVLTETPNDRVFIELFQLKDSIFHQIKSLDIKGNFFEFYPKTSGLYKLIIQPEIKSGSNFIIKIDDEPSYAFPVAGKSNINIQSYWGAVRDGGRRSHEGVDIFAPRGTPVISATEGRISRTGNTGLGGKQVWVREKLFGNSLYYAHLDSIAVEGGRKVEIGDTLGFVGNTGNAKTTAPHLHFGIYKGYSGAINPFPFIQQKEIEETEFERAFETNLLIVDRNSANIRIGPSVSFKKMGELKRNDTLLLLGTNKDWLHVKTTANQKGFLHESLVQELN